MNRLIKGLLLAIFFVVLFLAGYQLSGSFAEKEIIKRTAIIMSTVVQIQVRDEDEDRANKVIDKAFTEMRRIEKLFSHSDTSGYIWKLNHSSDTLVELNDEVRKMFFFCDSVWRYTNGDFDISLQPLVELWNFSGNPVLPTEAELTTSLESTGWNKISFVNQELVKNSYKFNLGAVAKGYAVDRAVQVLKDSDIEKALVDAGGEIKSLGKGWNVGIQDPDEKEMIFRVLKLENMSVATSGDYEQYFERGGKRYHHILDPKTGYPGNKCRSVTVISPDNEFADALATGIFIMGPEEGIKLSERLDNTEVLIIDTQGKVHMSAGFNKYIVR